MNDLEFGAYVLVSHRLDRCYVTATTTRFRPRTPTPSTGPMVWQESYESDLYFVSNHGDPCDGPDGLPGLPLPEPSPLPEHKGTWRLLRRFPVSRQFGVVVGRTFRLEGQYHAGYPAFMDDGGEPAQLDQSRRLAVFQVALSPERHGKHPWPAVVIDAHPDDVTRSPF